MAMVLHELATNAAKYGALSCPSGTIAIDWALHGDQFEMDWQERGGPRVSPPARQGFGSRLIAASLKSDLAGEARLDYRPSGLRKVTYRAQPEFC